MEVSTRPTVLIHGYGFDHRIWYPVELAFEGRHVIYLTLPGFGLEQVSEPYTIADLARKYWRHLNDVISEPIHLVGHSMGGYVCMEMISQNPSKVASLALLHSHVFEDNAEKKQGRSDTMKDISENGAGPFSEKLISSLFAEPKKHSEIIKMLVERGKYFTNDAWCYGIQAMRDRRDHAETLKNIKVPVLMLMGQQDKAVPEEIAFKQAPLSERTDLHLYPNVGHMAMYENPAAVIQDLIRFYDMVAA